MSYDVVLYIVQRGTDIHQDFLKFKEVFNNENLIKEYNKLKVKTARVLTRSIHLIN